MRVPLSPFYGRFRYLRNGEERLPTLRCSLSLTRHVPAEYRNIFGEPDVKRRQERMELEDDDLEEMVAEVVMAFGRVAMRREAAQ